MFGAVTLTKNGDPDIYTYSGYIIGFYSSPEFLFADGSFGKNIIILGADMSSYLHLDNKGKNLLILGGGPIQMLD